MRTIVQGPYTGNPIVCHTPEEYLRVIEWKRWVQHRRFGVPDRREADLPWRTEGRAEVARARYG